MMPSVIEPQRRRRASISGGNDNVWNRANEAESRDNRLSVVVPERLEGEVDPEVQIGSPTSHVGSPAHAHGHDDQEEPASPLTTTRRKQSLQMKQKRLWRRRVDVEQPKHVSTIPVESLMNFFRFVSKKTVTYRTFPFHLLFIFVFSVSVLVTRGVELSQTNFGLRAQYDVTPTDISQITNLDQIWPFLPRLATALWTPDPDRQSLPILFFALRQYRRGQAACQSSIVQPAGVTVLPTKCFSIEWSGDPMEYASTKNMFYRPSSFASSNHDAYDQSYPASSPHFTEYFSIANETLPSVLERLSSLQANGWVREGVGAVFVNVFLINRVDQHYTSLEVNFEVHVSGRLTPKLASHVFSPPNLDSIYGRGLFANELLLSIAIALLVYELVVSIRFNMCLDTKKLSHSVEAFDVYNLILIVFMIYLQSIRYVVWSMVFTQHSVSPNTISPEKSFEYLTAISKATREADWLVPWCILLAYFRTFLYLQYNERLGVINETLFSSVNELAGVGIIFVFVLLSFALASFYLFGFYHESFHTVGQALATMLRIMLSGEYPNQFKDFITRNPINGQMMFTFFVVLSWLVILNITVSVLANSFGAVFETKSLQKRPRWNPIIILRDIKLYVARLREPNTNELTPGLIPPGGIYVNSKFVIQGLLAIDALKTRNKEERISLEDLQTMTSTFIDNDRSAAIFRKAFLMIGNQNARQRQQKLAKKGFESRKKVTEHVVQQTSLISQVNNRIYCQDAQTKNDKMPQWMVQQDEVGLEEVRAEVAEVTDAMRGLSQDMEDQMRALAQLRKNMEGFF